MLSRTTWSLALVLALALGATRAEAATPVELHGPLSTKGAALVDSSGQPVILRGMSLFWSGWAGQFYNRRAIHWLAHDWKTSIIRAAVGVEGGGNYLDSANNGDLANLRRVDSVIQTAIDLGIYVIVDWHDHNAPDHQAKAIEFFQRMARKWGAYPNVLWEIYNEPHGDIAANAAQGTPGEDAWTWPQVKAYSEAVIDSIRAIDPDNVILVGTPNWSQDVDVASKSPILDRTNLAYVLHFYAGTHGLLLRKKAETAMSKGLAIFISEWGTTTADGGGGEDQEVYWSESVEWLNWADQKGISWCNWSIVAKEEASAALMPGASAKGWWPDTMISNSGWYVRDRLIEQETAWSVVAPVEESLLRDTAVVPGIVQAENFVAQSGIQTESGSDFDWSDDVGWIENGDWAEYLVRVPQAGSWYLRARVASNRAGGQLVVLADGVVLDTLEVEGTGGWQSWVSVHSGNPVPLPQGLVKLRLEFVGGTGSLYNLNWIAFSDTPDAVAPRTRSTELRLHRTVRGLEFDRVWDRVQVRDLRGGQVARAERCSSLDLPAASSRSILVLEAWDESGAHRRILPVRP
ncbi:MAG: cellulase family glycosylhydrolase [Fibrobacteria bacterium]|nr:cellulase family glycosylhydrolase [Fibrobacteria bacterium]